MSFVIVLVSSFSITLTVYADGKLPGETESHYRWRQAYEGTKPVYDALIEDGFGNHILYILSQLGAAADLDFVKVVQNSDVFTEEFINNNVSVNDDLSINYSADFVSQIKQALKEYQEENCGFIVLPTYSIARLSSDEFYNGYIYRNLVNLINEYGMVAFSPDFNYSVSPAFHGHPIVYDVSAYLDGSAGFYIVSNYLDSHTPYVDVHMADFMSWVDIGADCYYFEKTNTSIVSGSFSDLCDAGVLVKFSESFKDDFNITNICPIVPSFPGSSFLNMSGLKLITADGSNILVFKNKTAFQNYSIGHRSVFTSSKFYEDTGALTVPLEDLSKSISDLNGLLEKFRDSLSSDQNLTEDQLEDQLQKFLDDFFKRMQEGGSSGGSGSGSSSWSDSVIGDLFGYLEGIGEMLAEGFSSLSEGLSVITEQLDFISMEIGDMTQAQVEEKTDSFLSQLTSMFGEVAALVKTKFPFSMPWDVGNFFSVLGGDTVEVRAPDGGVRLVNAYAAVPAVYTDDAAVPAVISQEMSDSGAPVFRLPIVVASAGIDEEIVVDLSSFEYVHLISRGMLTVLYCLALMNLTFKVVDLGKGLVVKDD